MKLYCDTCQEVVETQEKSHEYAFDIRGEHILVDAHYYVCPNCGKDYFLPKDAKNAEEKAYHIYRERKGLLSPSKIKAIRLKYGLSQGLFSRILGLGEKTITRYENGYLPDPAPNNLIMLADDFNCFWVLWNSRKHEFTVSEQKKVESKLGFKNQDLLGVIDEKAIDSQNDYRSFVIISPEKNTSRPAIGLTDFLPLWTQLKFELKYKNRFFPDSPLLSKLLPYIHYATVMLSDTSNIVFYRAREKNIDDLSCEKKPTIDYVLFQILTANSSQKKKTSEIIQELKTEYSNDPRIDELERGFYGYNEVSSGAPPVPTNISDGRVNPGLISYLYLAEDPNTAISEISPIPSTWISIGIFKLIESVKLVDLSGELNEEFSQLSDLIAQSFSLIAKYSSDYYITQYIAEYIKKLGYDGIIFNSSKCKGKSNFVFFNEEKVKVIGSELYVVDSVKTINHKVFPL